MGKRNLLRNEEGVEDWGGRGELAVPSQIIIGQRVPCHIQNSGQFLGVTVSFEHI